MGRRLLPMEWKFRGGTRKYILKKLAERLGIPSALLHRRKQGFPDAAGGVDDGTNVEGAILCACCSSRAPCSADISSQRRCRSLVDEHVRGRRNRSGLLWRMLVLELWHRNFMESPDQWARRTRDAPDIFAVETKQSSQQEDGSDVCSSEKQHQLKRGH